MKLLLVDGSNLVMRAAFGGDIEPGRAVPIATGLIRRAAESCGATHLVAALDWPAAPSWRKQQYPEYKANHGRDTGPWLVAAHAAWIPFKTGNPLHVPAQPADLIATLAQRARGRGLEVTVCSGDSDLLPLTASGCSVLKPVNGGKYEDVTAAEVCAKYHIGAPGLLRDLKALAGESGDNIPGVAGIGPIRAARLLAEHKDFAGVIEAAGRTPKGDLLKVAQARKSAELSYTLAGLRTDAPILPLRPSDCRYANG